MRRENFLKGIWLGGRERKKCGEIWVFSPWTHQNVFSPKWGENWERESDLLYEQKFSQLLSWDTLPLPSSASFIFLFFCFKLNFLGNIGSFFFFFFWKNVGFLILFFIYLFSWGRGGDSDLFSFCYFFFLTWFLFFNKFGWLRFFFFLLFCHFLFLIGHYFLTMACE